ncbi:MAG: NAD(P)-dependent oxidoreductase, partial [Vicinamibacterales bacterium]
MRPQVLVTRKIPASVMVRLETACDVDRHDDDTPLSPDVLLTRVTGKQAILSMLTDQIGARVIEAATDLRIIANIAVGYNNLDLTAARARGIVVTNTPDVLTGATADLTWALILAITRRLGEGERMVRRKGWPGWAFDQLLGMELRGRQLGIVGWGRIGQAVAARAEPFGMHVAYAARPHRRGGP